MERAWNHNELFAPLHIIILTGHKQLRLLRNIERSIYRTAYACPGACYINWGLQGYKAGLEVMELRGLIHARPHHSSGVSVALPSRDLVPVQLQYYFRTYATYQAMVDINLEENSMFRPTWLSCIIRRPSPRSDGLKSLCWSLACFIRMSVHCVIPELVWRLVHMQISCRCNGFRPYTCICTSLHERGGFCQRGLAAQQDAHSSEDKSVLENLVSFCDVRGVNALTTLEFV